MVRVLLEIHHNTKKSKTVSFRVPEDVISEIEKEAKASLISTNNLINQILFNYTVWGRYQQRAKMYPVPEENLIHIIDHLDESQRKEAINHAYDAIREHALLSKKKFDLHSCLTVLQEYCRVCGISVEDRMALGKREFTVHHNLGEGFSLFIKEFIEKIFWEFVKIKVDFQLSKNTVIAKLQSNIE